MTPPPVEHAAAHDFRESVTTCALEIQRQIEHQRLRMRAFTSMAQKEHRAAAVERGGYD